MALKRVSDVTSEPLTLSDAKEHLRIDTTDQDSLLESYITAARHYSEEITGRAFGSQTYKFTLRQFPDGMIELPRPPLVSVDSIKYMPADGSAEATLDPAEYRVDTDAEPGTVEPVDVWPDTAAQPNAVTIQFTAGTPVPERGLMGMRQFVAHLEAYRSPAVPERVHKVPQTVETLLRGLRVWTEYGE